MWVRRWKDPGAEEGGGAVMWCFSYENERGTGGIGKEKLMGIGFCVSL